MAKFSLYYNLCLKVDEFNVRVFPSAFFITLNVDEKNKFQEKFVECTQDIGPTIIAAHKYTSKSGFESDPASSISVSKNNNNNKEKSLNWKINNSKRKKKG